MTIKVGCCGYPVSIRRYQEVFQVVELNSTFYEYPRDSSVEKWRRESPKDFEFTVKANQEISHKHKLKIEFVAEAFKKMKRICQILKARILLIQTPGSFKPDRLDDAYEFFEKLEKENLTLVWETRGDLWQKAEVQNELRTILEKVDVSHVTDPFKIMPAYTSHLAYFRLHGLGKRMYYYQYTDEEFRKLYDRVESFNQPDHEVYVFFNNLSMFEDARRFLFFLEKREFPSLPGTVGLDSVRVVIDRTRYPLTKSMLMKKLGWRIAELEQGKQVRLEELLRNLPSKSYKNAEEVIQEIRLARSY